MTFKKNEKFSLKIYFQIIMEQQRFVIFPIQYQDFWKKYKEQLANIWTVEAIDWSQDYFDFVNHLTEDERFYIKRILAFFAASDGIVSKNLNTNFIKDAEDAGILEAVFNYQFQTMIENIHNEAYSHMLDILIKDKQEKHELLNALQHIDAVKKKGMWAMKWIGEDQTFDQLPINVQTVLKELVDENHELYPYLKTRQPSFQKRLVAFAAVEGIFFSGSFCAIYWLKSTKKIMPGMCKANEWIARDEGAHQDFACMLYRHFDDPLPKEDVYEIVTEAVKIEQEFVTDALPVRLINMNSGQMCQYIEYVADRLLVQLGYPKIYHSEQPFNFIEMLSMKPKTNFFEDRVSDYQRLNVVSQSQSQNSEKNKKLTLDADF